MILKGNQRGGGRQMALHLLNGEQNEHVSVHEVSGFIAEDVVGALNEAYAQSKGTKCKQFMYSLSLSPPPEAGVDIATFEKAISRAEEQLGLAGQPRVVVFHEKEGRRHAHCVWSRIDIDVMKAINMGNDRYKLNALSKSIYLENDWKLPEGFLDKSKKSPLNFTRAEWQQAKSSGRKASDIKAELQECWAISDTRKSFEHALKESGYVLAQGDRRSFVVMDHLGEIYSLPRQLGKTKKYVEERLGKADLLQTLDQAKQSLSAQISPVYLKYRNELAEHHHAQNQDLTKRKHAMRDAHKAQRERLNTFQKERWAEEERQRASRVRYGFKGLWDKLSGRYWKIRKQNEKEAYTCHIRDQKQKDALIQAQLAERRELQLSITRLQEQQEDERKALIRDFAHIKLPQSTKEATQDKDLSIEQHYDGPEMEM